MCIRCVCEGGGVEVMCVLGVCVVGGKGGRDVY